MDYWLDRELKLGTNRKSTIDLMWSKMRKLIAAKNENN